MLSVTNIAAYKFVRLGDLRALRSKLRVACLELELKGTILLSPEGINLCLAGEQSAMSSFLAALRSDERFTDLETKQSFSDRQPFNRMLVKIKKEIIAFGIDEVTPEEASSAKIEATELMQWLDEGRDVTLLDVRNEFEVNLGTFKQAVSIGVDNFRDFPAAAQQLPDALKEKTLVMFCTGGIRCEKAGPFMEQLGFDNVLQLNGGILKYFEACGGRHYAGECFVFDKRVALDDKLLETETAQCFSCQALLSLSEQQSDDYLVGESCPHCSGRKEQARRDHLVMIEQKIAELADPLPGSQPYDNHRPLNVPLRYDQWRLLEFLCDLHPQVARDEWLQICELGRIQYRDLVLDKFSTVHAGQCLVQHVPATTEPDVSADIGFLHEDDALIVVNKPAPLPVHPCGRYNRNTLGYFLQQAYDPQRLRPAHRLDANTTGIVVFSRTRQVARQMQDQFSSGQVRKTYLVRVVGKPEKSEFASNLPISEDPSQAGLRIVCPNGLPSETRFRLLDELHDGTSLLEVVPLTGRTNQIRVHLWHAGIPVFGDPAYLPEKKLGRQQTLRPEDSPMCLHAWRLEFKHPRLGNVVELIAPAPGWATMDYKDLAPLP